MNILALRAKTEAGWVLVWAPSLSEFLFFRYLLKLRTYRLIGGILIVDDNLKNRNYLPPPYTIFGKGEENGSRNEVKTFWLRLRKVEIAAWIRA